jgi:glycosyltransferase involved in cell wall biosynthesis
VPPAAVVAHVTTVPFELPLFLSGQASFIRRSGFDVHAIASPGDDLPTFAAREGVHVHGVPMTRKITPLQDLVSLGRLVRLLRTIHPKIVHSHSPKGGLLGMLAARLVGAPVRIYHIRGLPFTTATGVRRRLLTWSERASCALATRVLAVSHSMRRIAIAESLCPEGKIKVLHCASGNGVDATRRFKLQGDAERLAFREECTIPAESLVIGFVGRLCLDKGIAELAIAWRALRDAEPRACLLLVGSVDEKDGLPADVLAALRADPRVHFTGEIRDTPRAYAAMDVVALPSYREGFPNVALEAAAMALPVVSTTVPGCVDAVEDGVTGTLVPPCDASALATALRRYLGDSELRRAHGAAGRARALKDYRPEDVWQAIAMEYGALLARAGIAPQPAARDEAR